MHNITWSKVIYTIRVDHPPRNLRVLSIIYICMLPRRPSGVQYIQTTPSNVLGSCTLIAFPGAWSFGVEAMCMQLLWNESSEFEYASHSILWSANDDYSTRNCLNSIRGTPLSSSICVRAFLPHDWPSLSRRFIMNPRAIYLPEIYIICISFLLVVVTPQLVRVSNINMWS